MKPLIGVTADTHGGSRIPTRVPGEGILFMWDAYLRAIADHGAVPVLLPIVEEKNCIQTMVDRLDGLLLAPGRFDLPPDLFGEERKPWLGPVKEDISRFECELVRRATKKDLPMFGICGGMQTINVALGGTLYQDIYKERPKTRNHNQRNREDKTFHTVTVNPNTLLRRIVTGKKGKQPPRLRVNSTHHQAIRDVAPGLRINCTAGDGVIEGVESDSHRFLQGVQWHPELLYNRIDAQRRLFRAFVRASKKKP